MVHVHGHFLGLPVWNFLFFIIALATSVSPKKCLNILLAFFLCKEAYCKPAGRYGSTFLKSSHR
jgi:hypothetical protein